MTREEILTKLKLIVADKLNVNESEVTEDKKITGKDNDCLGADSLDAVELIMEVEKEFDIAISDTHMEKLTTIKSIVDYIKSNTQ